MRKLLGLILVAAIVVGAVFLLEKCESGGGGTSPLSLNKGPRLVHLA